MEPRELAETIATVIDDRQGCDIDVYDVRGICDLTDYFVVATGNNARHVDAIVDEVENALRPQGEFALAVEGRPDCTWLLMDFGQVIVHVFQPDARSYYRLDRMWSDAPHATVDDEGTLEWHEGRVVARGDVTPAADAPDVEALIED